MTPGTAPSPPPAGLPFTVRKVCPYCKGDHTLSKCPHWIIGGKR